jgi:hypothetical protein
VPLSTLEGRGEALALGAAGVVVVVQGRSGGVFFWGGGGGGGGGVKGAAKAPRGTTSEGEQGQALSIPPDGQLSAGGEQSKRECNRKVGQSVVGIIPDRRPDCRGANANLWRKSHRADQRTFLVIGSAKSIVARL